MTKYEQMPKKAKVDRGSAWWYAERRAIELHVADGPIHFTVRLTLSKLRDYMRRMDRK